MVIKVSFAAPVGLTTSALLISLGEVGGGSGGMTVANSNVLVSKSTVVMY